MVRFVAVAGLAVALLATPAHALDVAEARHLLGRIAFAPTPGRVDALRPLDRAAAVAHLLAEPTGLAVRPPAWIDDWTDPRSLGKDREKRRAFAKRQRERAQELKAWWLRQMVSTQAPAREWLALFWHGHFTSSFRKVRSPILLYRQNATLRAHALGNFGALLSAILRDPAMPVYLDQGRSGRKAPNENLARELLELFTLGEGHYAEADVREVARALTGHSLDPADGTFRYRHAMHDRGSKTILGRNGWFDGDDVVKLLLAQPRTAELIVEKLWRALISPDLEPTEVERLAAAFRDGNYAIAPLLTALLTHDAFWAPANRGALIKSPLELVVGTLRLFEAPAPDGLPLARAARAMGQDPFDPPNVKGWPGGTAWITSATYLTRETVLRRITRGTAGMARREMDGAARFSHFVDVWVERLPADWRDAGRLTELVLALPPADGAVLDRAATGALVRGLMTDPVYQLK